MKISWTNFRTTPRDMCAEIDLVSTSSVTADASPIILTSSDQIQTKFVPRIVDNKHDPKKCISGKLIYEKKKRSESEFPTEKISRQSVKVGEFMEISLNTTEILALYNGLNELYSLHEELGSTPIGNHTFSKVDRNFRDIQAILASEPLLMEMVTKRENIDLVKLLLKAIAKTTSLENLKEGLSTLEQQSVDDLGSAVNSERLRRTLEILEENIDNGSEEEWQKIFKENQWLLSQLFSTPYTFFRDKAYVGGKQIDNSSGNVCDFIYRNELSSNVSLIEIKTPCAKIIGKEYRHTFSFSSELSGAVNQVLHYKDNLIKSYYTLHQGTDQQYEAISPRCYLIIGNLSELEPNQMKAFENYRNNFSAVNIITFDEIIQKTKHLIKLLDET